MVAPENGLIYVHPLKYTPPPPPCSKKLFEDVYKKVITEGCRTEYQIFWGEVAEKQKFLKVVRLKPRFSEGIKKKKKILNAIKMNYFIAELSRARSAHAAEHHG